MTDSVPVSPAAQAEPPELWWSPTCGLFGYVDGMGTGDSIGPLHARADDAVRLVPAPGPDNREADLLRSLDHLVKMWTNNLTYSGTARPEDDLRDTLVRYRASRATNTGRTVLHRFPPDWSWDGSPQDHPGPPRFTCCNRLPTEVGDTDRMAFSDDLVTCPGVRTDGETPR